MILRKALKSSFLTYSDGTSYGSRSRSAGGCLEGRDAAARNTKTCRPPGPCRRPIARHDHEPRHPNPAKRCLAPSPSARPDAGKPVSAHSGGKKHEESHGDSTRRSMQPPCVSTRAEAPSPIRLFPPAIKLLRWNLEFQGGRRDKILILRQGEYR